MVAGHDPIRVTSITILCSSTKDIHVRVVRGNICGIIITVNLLKVRDIIFIYLFINYALCVDRVTTIDYIYYVILDFFI